VGVLENLFFYFAGPIAFFNELLKSPEIYHLDSSGLLYGRATFGFITNLIEIVISFVFGYKYEGSDVAITSAVASPIQISNEIYGNAFCTSLYHFLRDFGSAGVFLGPILFASLANYIWNKAFLYKRSSESWLLASVYMSYCIIFSEWRYNLTFPHSGVVFILIFLSRASTHWE
jgi:oligosaccharide repeat unit polymerase